MRDTIYRNTEINTRVRGVERKRGDGKPELQLCRAGNHKY